MVCHFLLAFLLILPISRWCFVLCRAVLVSEFPRGKCARSVKPPVNVLNPGMSVPARRQVRWAGEPLLVFCTPFPPRPKGPRLRVFYRPVSSNQSSPNSPWVIPLIGNVLESSLDLPLTRLARTRELVENARDTVITAGGAGFFILSNVLALWGTNL